MDSRLVAMVQSAVGGPADGYATTRLKGDASNRSYYRVARASPPASWIVMVLPPGPPKSEEATGAAAAPAELPFVNVHRYLARAGMRVPAIHAFDPDAGMMVLEDLGDVTLEAALALTDAAGRERLYARAVEDLARLRVHADHAPDPDCLAFGRGFDFALYQWELDHFVEYGLAARLGVVLGSDERAVVDPAFAGISKLLAEEPRGFTHRDYQSRNLMVLPSGGLAVIDFQDALLGPAQYDLVALLRDSYVVLEPAFVDDMLARYRTAYQAAGGPQLPAARFRQVFDVLTVQRKLKDSGRFEFIARVKNNPSFLPHVPASLGYVREALARRPELEALWRVLAKHVPELA